MTVKSAQSTLLREIAKEAISEGVRIATAESCTGGLIAAALTDVAGSSDWFECGFVTYSNEAKISMLGVSEQTLAQFGAVSADTVTQMSEGALQHSRANIAVAVSGVAGPGGGSVSKPVGTVFLAIASSAGYRHCQRFELPGNRTRVREATVLVALRQLLLCIHADRV